MRIDPGFIGKAIRYRRRHELKITQEDLGEMIGVSRVVVNRYERGLTIPPSDKFCKIMGWM